MGIGLNHDLWFLSRFPLRHGFYSGLPPRWCYERFLRFYIGTLSRRVYVERNRVMTFRYSASLYEVRFKIGQFMNRDHKLDQSVCYRRCQYYYFIGFMISSGSISSYLYFGMDRRSNRSCIKPYAIDDAIIKEKRFYGSFKSNKISIDIQTSRLEPGEKTSETIPSDIGAWPLINQTINLNVNLS